MKKGNKTWNNLAWAGSILLIVILVGGALSRYLLPYELYMKVLTPLYGLPYLQEAIPAMKQVPVQEFLHRIGGVAFVVLGMFQFSKKFRAKYKKMHRNMGKTYLVLCLVMAIGGAMLGVSDGSFSGWEGAVPTLLFAGLLIFFTVKAYTTARNRKFMEHREWVIRTYALGLGVGTIRIFFLLGQYLTSWEVHSLFAMSIWLGFTTNLLIGEWWIEYTRPKKKPARAAAGATKKKVVVKKAAAVAEA